MDVVASLSHDSKIGPVRVNHKVSTTGDGTHKQGDVEISNLTISLRDGLIIDVSFVCEFKGSSRAPGGWNDGVRHTNSDVLQARANVKNKKYKDVYGLVLCNWRFSVCEFVGSSCALGGCHISVRYTHDVLQAHVNFKNNKDPEVYGLVVYGLIYLHIYIYRYI